MKWFFIEFSFLIFCFGFLDGQNLVPDGSFELSPNLQYQDPPSAFLYLDNWYSATRYDSLSVYKGSPDLFDDFNRWPVSDPPNFWNNATGAYDGIYHVGIANFFNFEGFLSPEALGTQLVEVLEPDAFYHVELKFRNKGVTGFENDPILCVPEGYKELELLFGSDSVFVIVEDQINNSYFQASKNITLHSPLMESQHLSGWNKIGTCFQAKGDEKYFGISSPVGRFIVEDPCVIVDEHWDVFYVYYFDIDDVKITKLPRELFFNKSICRDRSNKINIADLANLPVMQNEIEYQWDDGTVDSVNYISKAGVYHINALIDCTTIPITLIISDEDCEPKTYVPNVFLPNGDTRNNKFGPIVYLDSPIIEYQFYVYDRWGGLVFSSQEIENKWDGYYNGFALGSDVYIWTLEYTIDDMDLGKVNYKEQGNVTIIR